MSKGTACGRVGVIACRSRSAPRLLREQKRPHVKWGMFFLSELDVVTSRAADIEILWVWH